MKLVMAKKGEAAFDHPVPLAPEAVAILRTVHRLSGRGELVFPGQRHAHKPLSENAIGYLYNRGRLARQARPPRVARGVLDDNERAGRAGRASQRPGSDRPHAGPCERGQGGRRIQSRRVHGAAA